MLMRMCKMSIQIIILKQLKCFSFAFFFNDVVRFNNRSISECNREKRREEEEEVKKKKQTIIII